MGGERTSSIYHDSLLKAGVAGWCSLVDRSTSCLMAVLRSNCRDLLYLNCTGESLPQLLKVLFEPHPPFINSVKHNIIFPKKLQVTFFFCREHFYYHCICFTLLNLCRTRDVDILIHAFPKPSVYMPAQICNTNRDTDHRYKLRLFCVNRPLIYIYSLCSFPLIR